LLLLVLQFIPAMQTVARQEPWNYRQHSLIDWHDYDESAFALARAGNRALYVFIYADWCGWCRKFEKETLEQAVVRQRLARDFVAVAVDYSREPDLAVDLGAKHVPTSLLLTPNGELLLRFYGFLSADELEVALTSTLEKWRRGEIPDEEFGNVKTCCPLRRGGTPTK
jgi:thiol:disulfide interchange protein